MGTNVERKEMELSVEALATANRKNWFTVDQVIEHYIKKHPAKKEELRALEDLDRRIHEEITPDAEARGSIYRDRELARLRGVAGRVLKDQMEEDFRVHRRFGCYRRGAGWLWFEVRYASARFLELWRDVKESNFQRCGITVRETDIILDAARRNATDNINKVWREAMRKIMEMRSEDERAA